MRASSPAPGHRRAPGRLGAALGAILLTAGPTSTTAAAAPKRTEARKTATTAAAPATAITEAQMRSMIAAHTKEGRPVVLHLWATWCVSCMEELPVMGQFARELKDKGVAVVSVSLDEATAAARKKVGRLIQDKAGGALTNVLLQNDDPDAFVKRVDPRWDGEIPALFLYGRDGRLRRAYLGEAKPEALRKFVADQL